MFNVGGGELLVILVVALIVLGPAKLPDAARQMGRALNELRRLSSGFQREMRQALEETTETEARAKGKTAAQQSTAATAGMYNDADRVRTGTDGDTSSGAEEAVDQPEPGAAEPATEGSEAATEESEAATDGSAAATDGSKAATGGSEPATARSEPATDGSEPETVGDADAPGG